MVSVKRQHLKMVAVAVSAGFFLVGCATPPEREFRDTEDILRMGKVAPAPEFQSGSGRALGVTFVRMLSPGIAEISVPGTPATRTLHLEYVQPMTSVQCVDLEAHQYLPSRWSEGVKKIHRRDVHHAPLSEACTRFAYLEGQQGVMTIYHDDWEMGVSRGELRVEGINIGLTYVAEGYLDVTRRGQLREPYQLAQASAIQSGLGIWRERIENHELQRY